MIEIKYLTGDATDPQEPGNKIICHICNDIGLWGAGFVLAISKKWKEPEQQYYNWHKGLAENNFALGQVHFINVETTPDEIYIANMIGQRGVKRTSIGPPIRYDAVNDCLQKVADKALRVGASIHMPRIGCGLAGGKWEEIEPIIIDQLSSKDIPVFVYDFG